MTFGYDYDDKRLLTCDLAGTKSHTKNTKDTKIVSLSFRSVLGTRSRNARAVEAGTPKGVEASAPRNKAAGTETVF